VRRHFLQAALYYSHALMNTATSAAMSGTAWLNLAIDAFSDAGGGEVALPFLSTPPIFNPPGLGGPKEMSSLLHVAAFTCRPAKFSQLGLAVKLMTLPGHEAGTVRGSQQRLFGGVGTSPLKHVLDPCNNTPDSTIE